MNRAIRLSVVLIGFTAMASQIVLMRELLVVFYGNELSISFVLASWLIGGAIGSALFGRLMLPSLRAPAVLSFAFCQIAIGLFLPLQIAATRLIKYFLHVNPGEIIPLFPVIVVSFVVLAPLCAILGFAFALGCRAYEDPSKSAAARISAVYILEAVGSIIGGAITSFALIQVFDAMHIAVILALVNLIMAAVLCLVIAKPRNGAEACLPGRQAIPLFLIAMIVALWSSGALKQLDVQLLKKQWQGYDLISAKNSIYGNIAIAKRGEDYSFFDNGLLLYTIPDRMRSEEAVHIALLEHPDPKKILLIGGGAGGLIEEILKHKVSSVDYCELDPLIIKMAENNLPQEYCKALKDPKVSIKFVDGRFFVKTTKGKYDCVIMNIGDPYTAQLNRYYTVEFFGEVKNILNKGGILSFSLTSSENYISKDLAAFTRSIYATAWHVFKDVLIIPGETAYFLASDGEGYLTYDYKLLEARTLSRALDTKYAREYYLSSRLSPEKINYVEGVVKEGGSARINSDSRPISYYYGLIFWATLFKDSLFSTALRGVTAAVVWKFIGLFIILVALASTIFKRSFRRASLMAIMAGGFSSMAFQILILLAFQTMYGYLFYKLGVILTAFMAGLAIGASLVIKMMEEIKRERLLMIAIQGDFLIFSVILAAILSGFCPESIFPLLSLLAGSICGSQFAIVSKVLTGLKDDVGRIGGLSYGMDLAGSFLGALFTGVFLVPIVGIAGTCYAIALINLSILLLLILNLRVEE